MTNATEFWNEREVLDFKEQGAIRILVCGNTGIGKSTLINEVFGTEVVGFGLHLKVSGFYHAEITPDPSIRSRSWNPQYQGCDQTS